LRGVNSGKRELFFLIESDPNASEAEYGDKMGVSLLLLMLIGESL
jgi:hypothetical protein